jgi:hypothetical protein
VIPEPTDEEEAVDAARDHALAIESRRVPPMLYDRVAVHVGADPALALLDLHSVAVRERLALAPAVAHELRYRGFAQLDRGALLAPQRARHRWSGHAHGQLTSDVRHMIPNVVQRSICIAHAVA